MTEKSTESFASNVVLYRDPTLETIIPTSGINKDKEISVLTLKTFHPNFERTKEGDFKQLESDFYTVKVYGVKAERVAQHLKNGMTLEIRGEMFERTYTGKDEKEHTEKVIDAKAIGLSLTQSGIKSIDYERPEKKVEKAEEAER